MNRAHLTFLAALAAPLATLPSAKAADLAGTWLLNSDVGGQSETHLCVLKANQTAVGGSCTGTQGHNLKTTGHTDDDGTMHLKYATDYNGSGVHLEYSGKPGPGGVVKGSVTTGSANGVFVATPLVKSADGQSQSWKIDVNLSASFRYLLVCTFHTSGSRFRGPCTATDGPTLPTSGTTDGATMTLGYDTAVQNKLTSVSYTGSLQPDGSLKGAVKAGSAAGSFTAQRQ